MKCIVVLKYSSAYSLQIRSLIMTYVIFDLKNVTSCLQSHDSFENQLIIF